MYRKLLLLALTPVLAFGQGSQLPKYTVATLPAASTLPSYTVQVLDGANDQDCVTGHGSKNVLCKSNGTAWVPVSPFQSLTTTGTSGPATLNLGVLNIPDYSGESLAVAAVSPILVNGGAGPVSSGTATISCDGCGTNFTIGITPPDNNQGIFVPFTSFNTSRLDPCSLITSAEQDATSGAVISIPGSLVCHNSEAIFTWTSAVLPSGIPAANVTSVRAVASSQILEGGLSFKCNGTAFGPIDIPFQQNMIVLSGITGSNIGTASCVLDMAQSAFGTIMNGAVSQIGLWVEYTGTPVTDPSLKVQYPLLYTGYDNTLSLTPYWPNGVTALTVADLPAPSTSQAGPGYPQYLVKDLVDDSYGVAAVGGGSKYGWVQSNGSGYTVSSGFANTLENGFVGDVPYQTGPNKTAYLHPGKTPGHTYAVGWKPGIPTVVQGAGCWQTCTFPQPVTAGDLIFVVTSDTATIAPVGCGISDSLGTSYTVQQSSGGVITTYTGIVGTSGNVVISLTGADASHCYGSIAEITGADTTTPVDVNGSVVSTLGTSINPTITTALNNDLLIAWEGLTNSAPVTITPSAGLTFIGGTNNTYATNSWSAPGATAGAYSATFTSSGPSGVYAFYGGIVGIKAAAAGGATDPVAIDLASVVAGVASLNSLGGSLSLTSSDASITVTPSGSTIDLKAVGGGGGGLSGQTTNYLPKATSATTSTTSSIIEDQGTGIVVHGTGTSHGITLPEGTAISASAGNDILYADSTNHCIQYSANGGSFACLGSGSSSTLTQGTQAVGNSSNAVASLPYDLYPNAFATGSGTEASPWVNSTDNTAGIQTVINSLAAGRGGQVTLAPGYFKISTPILASADSIGLVGLGQGYNIPPNGETEGISGLKLRVDPAQTTGIAGVVAFGRVGGGYGNTSNGLYFDNLYMFGQTTTCPVTNENNSGFYAKGWNDQTRIHRLAITNFCIGAELQSSGNVSDGLTLDNSDITGNNYALVEKMSTDGSWWSRIIHNTIFDNNYQGVAFYGNGGTSAGLSIPGDGQTFALNSLGRNCSSATCAGFTNQAANIYWERNGGNVFGNVSVTAGYNISGTHVSADGVILKGDYINLADNQIIGQTQTGEAGIRVIGNHNYVHGNKLRENDTDVIVASGATDNVIDQPSATVTDAGTRTVINGVSTNAGDPNSTGAWNGVAKWAGLIINDTTNNVQWLYLNTSSRIQLNAGTTYTGTSPIVVSGGAISCPTCSTGTGTNVGVNGGAALGTVNLNGTTPAAPSGNTNVTFQVSGNNVSAYVPSSGSYPAAVTVSGTAVTELDVSNACFSSSYHVYDIIVDVTMVSASSVHWGLQMQTASGYDTGSNYSQGRYYVEANGGTNIGNTTSTTNVDLEPSGNPNDTESTGVIAQGTVRLFNPLDSTHKKRMQGHFSTGVEAGIFDNQWTGVYIPTTALTGFRFYAGGTATFTGKITCQPIPE